MHETFTQDLNETYCKTEKSDDIMNESSPRESAVEFIKQFARAYSYDRRLCSDLCGYVAN